MEIPNSSLRLRPLDNHLIVSNIFKYLSFQEILKCRYVCKEWRRCGEKYLQSNAVIHIRQKNFNSDNLFGKNSIYKSFFQVFKSSSFVNGWTSFRFSREDKWPISWIHNFFNDVPDITSLRLMYSRFTEDALHTKEPTVIISFNVAEWLNKLDDRGCTVKELYLASANETHLKTDTQCLQKLSVINFEGTEMLISPNIILSPKTLFLRDIIFKTPQNEKIPNSINAVFDLQNINNLSLHANTFYNDSKQFILNVGDKHNFDQVFLRGVKLLNWNTSNWNVKKLTMVNYDFFEKTGMEIDELHILTTRMIGVDLKCLPHSITKLFFDHISFRHTDIQRTEGHPGLNNLKFLSLRIATSLRDLKMFKNNANLTNVELTVINIDEPLFLFLSDVSEHLRVLKLTNVHITRERHDHIRLNRLILVDYTLPRIKLFSTLTTRELVIQSDYKKIFGKNKSFGQLDMNFVAPLRELNHSAEKVYLNLYSDGTKRYRNVEKNKYILKTESHSSTIPKNLFDHVFKTMD